MKAQSLIGGKMLKVILGIVMAFVISGWKLVKIGAIQ